MAGALLLIAYFFLDTSRSRGPEGARERPDLLSSASEPVDPLVQGGREERQPGADPGEARGEGRLQSLSVFERRPVSDLDLLLSADVLQKQVRTDESGMASVPEGKWSVRSLDPNHVVLDGSIQASPGETSTVWVASRASIVVEALEIDGTPVSGARIRWVPAHANPDKGKNEEYTTDQHGRAYLASWVESPGQLTVAADGMSLVEHHVQGPIENRRVRVFLRRSTTDLHLCTTDPNGSPLADVTVVSEHGALGTTGMDGALVLPSWIPLGAELIASKEGYSDGRTYAGHESCLELSASSLLELIVRGSEGEIYASIIAPESDAVLLPRLQLMSGPEETFRVPSDVRLQVEVVDSHGLQGKAEVQLNRSSQSELIVFMERPKISVDSRPGSGEPLACMTEISFGEEFGSVRLESDGVTWLPFVERVQFARISSAGFETILLKPINQAAASLPGVVRAPLEPAPATTFLLRTTTEEPLRGMRITAWPQVSGFAEHPDLHGGWPTNHPGWSIHRGTPHGGLSDSAGSWTTRLPRGQYRIMVDVPAEYGTPESPSTLYFGQTKLVSVDGPAPQVIRVSSPVFLSFDVFEQTTLLPVAEVQVGGDVVPELPRKGNHWEGWVPEDTRSITVVAPGVGSARAWLPLQSSVIVVSPERPGTIVVKGMTSSPSGMVVFVDLFERWGVNRIGFGKTKVSLAADGTAQLFVPYSEVQDFGLESPDFEFYPETMEWEPGGRFEFEARAKD